MRRASGVSTKESNLIAGWSRAYISLICTNLPPSTWRRKGLSGWSLWSYYSNIYTQYNFRVSVPNFLLLAYVHMIRHQMPMKKITGSLLHLFSPSPSPPSLFLSSVSRTMCNGRLSHPPLRKHLIVGLSFLLSHSA